jgi:hypothetical protein
MMLRESLLSQFKEALVRLNDFIPCELYRHGAVSFCPWQLPEDPIQVFSENICLARFLILFSKMPEKTVVNFCRASHGIPEHSFCLRSGMNFGFDGQNHLFPSFPCQLFLIISDF